MVAVRQCVMFILKILVAGEEGECWSSSIRMRMLGPQSVLAFLPWWSVCRCPSVPDLSWGFPLWQSPGRPLMPPGLTAGHCHCRAAPRRWSRSWWFLVDFQFAISLEWTQVHQSINDQGFSEVSVGAEVSSYPGP